MNSAKMKSRRKSSRAERELERIKKRQEMYIDAMDDLTALRDHYKAEVRKRLDEKVKKQRKKREQQKALEAETEEKLAKEKKLFKVNLPKSTAVEDVEFLQRVKLSKFYTIIQIRDQLEKNNDLDKKYKLDEFNKIIMKPGLIERLQYDLQKGHPITFAKIKDMANAMSNEADLLPNSEEVRHLEISDEDDVFTNRRTTEGKKIKTKHLKNPDTKTHNSNDTYDIEEMFPSISYPELQVINRNFDSPEPDPLEVESKLKREKRRQAREKKKKMVGQMFKKSQSYEAATERLMTKFKKLNFPELTVGSDTKEIFNLSDKKDSTEIDEDLNRLQPEKSVTLPSSRFPLVTKQNRDSNIERYLDSLGELSERLYHPSFDQGDELKGQFVSSDDMKEISSDAHSSQWKGRVFADVELKKQILGVKEIKREPVVVTPLTMSALEETVSVKVVRGPSSIWINPQSQTETGLRSLNSKQCDS